jgi:sugar phosphate isomerase/epimerase
MPLIPVLFSVGYSGSWGQAKLSVEECVDKAATLGFHGVMLGGKRPHLSPLDWNCDARKRLRDRIAGHGLERVYVAAYNNLTGDLEHGEVPSREIQTLYITELARLCHDLGGQMVRVFTGYEHPAAGYLAQWNMVVATLKECAKRAADFDIVIGVQNHHDLGVDWRSQKDLIEAVDEPNCKALFDAWSPALQGADLAEAARNMAPLACHTTVADYQQRPRFVYQPEVINYRAETPYSQAVPMGEGFIDYRAFLTTLRDSGFEGSVAYEMCSPLLGGGCEANLDRYAKRFLEYLSELRLA